MSEYKSTNSGAVIRTSDGATIPDDPRNTGYQKYLKWVAAGGVVDPVDSPTPEELAVAAQAAKDLADRQETHADAKFRALINRTPAQVRSWVRISFPSLTLPEQNDLATIAQAIAILARRL